MYVSWVAHYTIDMVSDPYDGYCIELFIGYGLMLMVHVMLMGWLVQRIEKGQVRKQNAFTTGHSKPPLSPSP
jgi:hypothetical protein